MYNDLFSIGKVTIHGYGFMIAIGFLLAVLISYYRFKKNNKDPEMVFDIALIAMFTGFLGAKILYIIVEFKHFLENPLSVLGSAGFVVYGGLIMAAICIFLYCKYKKKENFFEITDIMMPQISIGQAVGRIGCFLAGCCYGAETDSPLGVIFPKGSIAPAGVKLWPTQLFCTAGNLVIAGGLFLVTYICYNKLKGKLKPGLVTSGYFILYGIGRFILEFFRADRRGSVGVLSTSQFISIFIIIAGIALLTIRIIQSKKEK